ncbi:hypothetical protein HFP15_10045 [Amycolatopsis sp. K13G38]|uniref:Uncharacterized protein n=1 Tax=Amycolatopsis acididurans TaxID=2724524 RepID=A0ABX1J0C2_9PSEU|nr:hypothetical protein [Amycolatopsis acididurans]NKQ53223.1 hypothetical protein [Amycolatopsis acididurans]
MLISLFACVSAALLALCIVFTDPWYGYGAVAASLIGVAIYFVDKVLRRRKAAEPAVESGETGETEQTESEEDEPAAEEPEETLNVEIVHDSGDVVVATIPGRRRYHTLDCELLRGEDFEEITETEARAEGFTACTACAHAAGKRVRIA